MGRVPATVRFWDERSRKRTIRYVRLYAKSVR